MRVRLTALIVVLASTAIALTGTAHAALRVTWMPGVKSPGTPARYDKVGVIKVGPATAKNVLVLEPGTSAGATYFVPLARQSHISAGQLTLVNRRSTYAHNDPSGAYPHNVFFSHLLPFLRKASATAARG
jgi:hypothetical protein